MTVCEEDVADIVRVETDTVDVVDDLVERLVIAGVEENQPVGGVYNVARRGDRADKVEIAKDAERLKGAFPEEFVFHILFLS